MTYEEWASSEAVVETHHFGYLSRAERCVMEMLGQHIFVETFMPHNVFKPTTQRVVAQNFNITADDPIMELAKKHGAEWEEGYYAEDGYGWPFWFDGGDIDNDGVAKCFAFITEYKETQLCTVES